MRCSAEAAAHMCTVDIQWRWVCASLICNLVLHTESYSVQRREEAFLVGITRRGRGGDPAGGKSTTTLRAEKGRWKHNSTGLRQQDKSICDIVTARKHSWHIALSLRVLRSIHSRYCLCAGGYSKHALASLDPNDFTAPLGIMQRPFDTIDTRSECCYGVLRPLYANLLL